jgi:acetyltransferase-like isoleucine patch superfamily enzyme
MNKLKFLIYYFVSKLPDIKFLSFYFNFITRVRAIVLSFQKNKILAKGVKIYRNVDISWNEEISIGEKTVIKENVVLSGKVIIGKNVEILCNTWIDGIGIVKIGDYSHIGRENHIYSHWHDISMDDTKVCRSASIGSPVFIGSNVMLYSRVGVMPGVKINNGAVIGYGSIVTKEIEENSICVGCPAKKINERKRRATKG